jgi:hypothetical protein
MTHSYETAGSMGKLEKSNIPGFGGRQTKRQTFHLLLYCSRSGDRPRPRSPPFLLLRLSRLTRVVFVSVDRRLVATISMVQRRTHSPFTKVRALLDVFPPLHSLPPPLLSLVILSRHPWPHLTALLGALLGTPRVMLVSGMPTHR